MKDVLEYASKKIFVLAGRHDQFRLFRHQLAETMISEGIDFRYQDFVYISDIMVLRGHRNPWGYTVGTWMDRPDIDQIKEMLLICGSSLDNDFIEVSL